MDYKKKVLPPNPIVTANPVSKLLMLWIFPLFQKGYRNELRERDFYQVLKEHEASYLTDKLEQYWQIELDKAKHEGSQPSLLRALLKMSWKTMVPVILLYIINHCAIVVSQPILLRGLIETFGVSKEYTWQPYVYAGGLSILTFLNTLTIQPAYFQEMKLVMKLRVATSALIYRKSLKLSKASQNATNSGHIVNLLANDCAKFDLAAVFLPFVVVAPLQVAILTYLLYDQIGLTFLAGVGFIVLLLPMNYYFGKYSGIFRLRIAKQTDERSRFMSEIVTGIRVIKQYAWERPFSLLVHEIRRKEITELRKRGLLRGFHHATFTFSAKLVQYLTFLAFVLIEDKPMTADKVFFVMTCLHTMIQVSVSFAPEAAAGVGEILVAIKRIQRFMLLDEQTGNEHVSDHVNKSFLQSDFSTTTSKSVKLENASASWTLDKKLTLENISFSTADDQLVMVVGSVGSSKTSLLQAILNELPLSSGKLSVTGTVSYASQEAWIFGGSLKQNILFDLPYEETHYKATIKACALEEDLKQLPYGDLTVVGDRGVLLSGGQKTRLNLARAIYRKSDIYLLDDPLSAVDTKVSRHLFESCINEYLKGSLRVLVTHQLQYLPEADHIIVLNHGKVLAQGTFQQLVDAGIDFVGLINTHEVTDDFKVKKRPSTTYISKPEVEKTAKKPEVNVEKKMIGSVTARTYREYFMAGHSVYAFLLLVSTFVLCQLVTSGNDLWLSYWTNAEQRKAELENNVTICIDQNNKLCEDNYLGRNIYLYVYTGFAVAVIALNICRGLGFYSYCAKISAHIHNKMFQSVVRAPVRFFDENASGRIMNRFTKDVGTMDEMLPPAFIDALNVFLQAFGVICVIIISNYYMSVPTVFLLVTLYFMRRIFIQTARDIKRIESITKSPLFTHVTATLQGLTTIRACNAQNVLTKQFQTLQDMHTSSWFLFIGANRCFGIWLELISDIFLALVAFSFLLISSSQEGGNVGLAVSSILNMMGTFQWGMRQSAETENYMTSVERALEYSKLEPEAELESKPNKKPPEKWPEFGEIEFRNVSLSYDQDKPVLKNLSFRIGPSEKIGIVGRTGAGKSSIITALFRLTEPEGEILIDKVPVKQIGLHDLRKNISIIPQDPVLFSGSVRYNLDPFNQFQDDQLWSVIEETELKEAVSSLDYLVADGGSNFSVGQRQLVCLARAILRKCKILVMDEATANVDPATDYLIQQTIRNKFAECTIITIAHRLHSIIDCDRILILDKGQLKEYEHPYTLLQNEQSIFSGMVAQTGPVTSVTLRKLANEAYLLRQLARNAQTPSDKN